MYARRNLVLMATLALLVVAPGFYSRPPAIATPSESSSGAVPSPAGGGLRDVCETLRLSTDCTIFLGALASTNTDEALRGRGPFTVFAPTDEAFRRLPKDLYDGYMQDQQNLTRLVQGHIVRGTLSRKAIKSGLSAKTLLGSELFIQSSPQGFTVDHRDLNPKKFVALNGVVYTVDTVLVPGS